MEINGGLDPARADQVIIKDFIRKVEATGPGSLTGNHSVTQEDKAGKKESKQFAHSRRLATATITGMKSWWYSDTENYIFLSNLGDNSKPLINKMQSDIERYRKAYATLIPPRKPINDVSIVRAFASEKEYKNYVGPDCEHFGGVWMARRKEMILCPVERMKPHDLYRYMLHLMYHEAFHQYIHYALDHVDTSAWFNEGHAELFESSRTVNGKIEAVENPHHVELVLKALAGKNDPIQPLLRMSYSNFSIDKNQKTTHRNYAMAWALVYYLRKGAPLEQPANNAGILDRYTDNLWDTKDPLKATERAFSHVNQYNFRKDFTAFWKSKKARQAASENHLFQ
jgi:hypothetical protein